MWPFRFAMHGKRGLRMMVVSILSSGPKNGAELMDGVETMTRGWWRPTPGSIYPLLTRMTDEGTVTKLADGRYELTDSARRELEVTFGRRYRRPQGVEDVFREIESLLSYVEDLQRSKGSDLDAKREAMADFGRRFLRLGERKEEK